MAESLQAITYPSTPR